MARGGVYDQLGGGFHRYSVDERWLVPHFEKMSYDNSELLKNYLHAYQVTRAPLFRQTAEGIIDWVNGVLSDRERGGFYASQDADVSLDDDGDYFTWTQEEVRAALPADQARVIELYYDVGPAGEMHHNPAKNVLWVARDRGDDGQAARHGRRRSKRSARKGPGATAGRACHSANAVRGHHAVHRLERHVHFRLPGCRRACSTIGAGPRAAHSLCARWTVSWRRAGTTPAASRIVWVHEWLYGSLDDQVQMAAALLDAFEATLDRRYFDGAERAAALVLDKYADRDGGGFFDRSSDAPPMGGLDVRRKPAQDSPTPAGNPAAAMVLDRLYAYTGDGRYQQQAEATLNAFAGIAPQYGLFAATYGLASVLHARHPLQIVVTGAEGDEAAEKLAHAARSLFRFGKAVLRVTPQRLAGAALPAASRETLPRPARRRALALVCAGTRCYPPVDQCGKAAGTAGADRPRIAGCGRLARRKLAGRVLASSDRPR